MIKHVLLDVDNKLSSKVGCTEILFEGDVCYVEKEEKVSTGKGTLCRTYAIIEDINGIVTYYLINEEGEEKKLEGNYKAADDVIQFDVLMQCSELVNEPKGVKQWMQ